MQSTSIEPAPTDSTIIRTVQDGRRRFTPVQRQELLEAFDHNGMSAMAFARDHGVHYQTFIAWLRKRRQGEVTPGSGPAFAEVVLDQPSGFGPVLRVPAGSIIEIATLAHCWIKRSFTCSPSP